jgi:hypothetical protein
MQAKHRLENELSCVMHEMENVDDLHQCYIGEIENIISQSTMNESTRKNNRVSITAGDHSQINVASDDATIHATQNNNIDWKTLHKLLDAVKDAATNGMTPEDQKTVSESLEVIENEVKRDDPHKSLLKTALKGLQAVMGTLEFVAAVTALINFVQTLFE